MGRVDDAMRRATGNEREPAPVSPADTGWPLEFAAPSFAKPAAGASPPAAAAAAAAVADLAPSAATHLDEFDPREESAAEGSEVMDHLDPVLREKVVVDRSMEPSSREQYRRLAATLYHQQADTDLRVLMIASAGPGEGKTLTAVNLALTLSESYRRTVLLIDADLRRPSLHKAFKVDGSPGLMEGMLAGDDWKMPLHRITSRLTLLTAGKASNDPMFGLTSPRMRRLIAEAREKFAWVIIDTPPVGLLTDANLLAAMVDAVALVVKAGETSHDQVRRAIDALGPGKLLGVVLNRAIERSSKYGYDYAKYYVTHPQG